MPYRYVTKASVTLSLLSICRRGCLHELTPCRSIQSTLPCHHQSEIKRAQIVFKRSQPGRSSSSASPVWMQAWRAREWSWLVLTRQRWPKQDSRRLYSILKPIYLMVVVMCKCFFRYFYNVVISKNRLQYNNRPISCYFVYVPSVVSCCWLVITKISSVVYLLSFWVKNRLSSQVKSSRHNQRWVFVCSWLELMGRAKHQSHHMLKCL